MTTPILPAEPPATPDDAVAKFFADLEIGRRSAPDPTTPEEVPTDLAAATSNAMRPAEEPGQVPLGTLVAGGPDPNEGAVANQSQAPPEAAPPPTEAEPMLPPEVLAALQREANETPSFAQALTHAVMLMSAPELAQNEMLRHEARRQSARQMLLSLLMEEHRTRRQEKHEAGLLERERVRLQEYEERQAGRIKAEQEEQAKSGVRRAAMAAEIAWAEADLATPEGRDRIAMEAERVLSARRKDEALYKSMASAQEWDPPERLAAQAGMTLDEALAGRFGDAFRRQTDLYATWQQKQNQLMSMREQSATSQGESLRIRQELLKVAQDSLKQRTEAELAQRIRSLVDLQLRANNLAAQSTSRAALFAEDPKFAQSAVLENANAAEAGRVANDIQAEIIRTQTELADPARKTSLPGSGAPPDFSSLLPTLVPAATKRVVEFASAAGWQARPTPADIENSYVTNAWADIEQKQIFWDAMLDEMQRALPGWDRPAIAAEVKKSVDQRLAQYYEGGWFVGDKRNLAIPTPALTDTLTYPSSYSDPSRSAGPAPAQPPAAPVQPPSAPALPGPFDFDSTAPAETP